MTVDNEIAKTVLPERDLLITAVETNERHGVGVLLRRIFHDSSEFVCLRTTSLYGGHEPFGTAHHELCSRFLTVSQVREHLAGILALYRIRRIVCVPYYREEFVHAVLAKEATGAPLVTYLMDDQNIFARNVPDRWVRQLLKTSDLVLGISVEMCTAYRAKFGHDVALLPPLLNRHEPLIPNYWVSEGDLPIQCAMIGNVWTAARFRDLRTLAREAGATIDWYGNGPKASWIEGNPDDWEADGIRCLGFLPDDDLIAALASYPFIIVPSGTLGPDDDNPAFSRLSLPSRLIFLHARTDTPVVVMGSPDTAAGRFVLGHGTGLCSTFNAADFINTAGRIMSPPTRDDIRRRIRGIAERLVMDNMDAWIWDSLTRRKAQDASFQEVFEGSPPQITVPPLEALLSSPEAISDFHEKGAQDFAFLKTRHIPVVWQGPDRSAQGKLEVTQFAGHAATFILRGVLGEGAKVLFIGEHVPPSFGELGPDAEIWTLKGPSRWAASGFSGDPEHLSPPVGHSHPTGFQTFDAIVSTGWSGQLADHWHAREGFALFLDACTRPGGWNVHFFPAVLHPTFFWVNPVHGHLLERFIGQANWPGMSEVLDDPTTFFMGPDAYSAGWERSTGKNYEAFGRPLGLGLVWTLGPAK